MGNKLVIKNHISNIATLVMEKVGIPDYEVLVHETNDLLQLPIPIASFHYMCVVQYPVLSDNSQTKSSLSKLLNKDIFEHNNSACCR